MRRFALSLLLSVLALPACGSALPGPVDLATEPAGAAAAELFARGRAAAANGDSVRAEQYFSLAVERGYSIDEALPLLLQVCLSNSRLRAALNHAEPYLRDHPESAALRYLVATIRLGIGEEEEARLELEQILQSSSDSSDAHYLLGVMDEPASPSSARAHFREYLELAPQGRHAADVRTRLSVIAIREGQTADARAEASP